VCLLLQRTGLDRFVAASSGAQHQSNRQREEAIVAYRREESARLAKAMPAQDLTLAKDATSTGGRCLVAVDPKRNAILLEQAAPARDQGPWHALMKQALAGLNCRIMPSTSDAAPGLLAYVAHHLGAPHSPDVFHVQHELVNAVSGPLATKPRAAVTTATEAPERCAHVQGQRQGADNVPDKRGAGRPPTAPPSLEQGAQAGQAAHPELERLRAQRAQVAQRLRASGHADPFVALERGVRRHGQRMAADIQTPMETMRTVAQQASLRQTCLARMEKAARGVPKRQATIAFVSGDVRQQGAQLRVPPPVSSAMPAHLMPSFSLERGARTRTVQAGAPLRELAARLRAPRWKPGGALATLSEAEHSARQQQAKELAEVCQRSSANVEGRNGALSLRNHQLRGVDRPRKRACLTAMHHFFLTRADGTTAAERFFRQKPRSMFAVILASVDLPPAPLSPPRRVEG
jgi:hypothetical protein